MGDGNAAPPRYRVADQGNVSLRGRRMAEQITQQPSDSYVQSFARGLSVIRAFGPERSQMTLSEVAAVTGLTRAGARRILLTLEHLGYVTVDDRKFSLTPRILELGYAYLSGTPLWNLALPYMEEVAERPANPAPCRCWRARTSSISCACPPTR